MVKSTAGIVKNAVALVFAPMDEEKQSVNSVVDRLYANMAVRNPSANHAEVQVSAYMDGEKPNVKTVKDQRYVTMAVKGTAVKIVVALVFVNMTREE